MEKLHNIAVTAKEVRQLAGHVYASLGVKVDGLVCYYGVYKCPDGITCDWVYQSVVGGLMMETTDDIVYMSVAFYRNGLLDLSDGRDKMVEAFARAVADLWEEQNG